MCSGSPPSLPPASGCRTRACRRTGAWLVLHFRPRAFHTGAIKIHFCASVLDYLAATPSSPRNSIVDARSSPLQAEAVVAEQRRLVATEGQRHRPELAKALSRLSRAYERDDRIEEALAAARESVPRCRPTSCRTRTACPSPCERWSRNTWLLPSAAARSRTGLCLRPSRRRPVT